ncbi:hypothetical protein, partial [Pseudomonas aeruginosa]
MSERILHQRRWAVRAMAHGSQAEFGLCCPVSMTDSLTRTLRRFGAPELVERYLPSLASREFDELFQGAMF